VAGEDLLGNHTQSGLTAPAPHAHLQLVVVRADGDKLLLKAGRARRGVFLATLQRLLERP